MNPTEGISLIKLLNYIEKLLSGDKSVEIDHETADALMRVSSLMVAKLSSSSESLDSNDDQIEYIGFMDGLFSYVHNNTNDNTNDNTGYSPLLYSAPSGYSR